MEGTSRLADANVAPSCLGMGASERSLCASRRYREDDNSVYSRTVFHTQVWPCYDLSRFGAASPYSILHDPRQENIAYADHHDLTVFVALSAPSDVQPPRDCSSAWYLKGSAGTSSTCEVSPSRIVSDYFTSKWVCMSREAI